MYCGLVQTISAEFYGNTEKCILNFTETQKFGISNFRGYGFFIIFAVINNDIG